MLWQLAQRVGRQGAAALVLCGDVLDGEEAAAAGLAWRCLPTEDLEASALRLARRAAGRPRDVMVRARATLDASSAGTLDEARALEHEAQSWSLGLPELPERVRALQARLAERST
jgi:enoyl-CoA hydratase